MSFQWDKYQEWRRHPLISRSNNYKHALPGLGLGFGAFLVYVAYDQATAPKGGSHH